MPSPDEQFWLGLGIGALGIALTLAIAWYQRQVPELHLSFRVPEHAPASLYCTITNTGRGQATNVALSFSFMLPVETKLHCDAEVLASLEEAPSPPDPVTSPHGARLHRAFAVRIPRVAPRDSIQFEISTGDADNVRAAAQSVRIRTEIEHVLAEFGNRLATVDPGAAARWNLPLILAGRAKTDSPFHPSVLSFDRGRLPVSALSPAEEEAAAACKDIYAAFKSVLSEVFEGRPEFKAPVYRIKTSDGSRTYAVFPPFVSTYVDALVRIPRDAKQFVVYPPVPQSYEPSTQA